MREILPTCVGKPFSRDPILVAVGECARGEGAGLYLVTLGYTWFAPGYTCLKVVAPGYTCFTLGYTCFTLGYTCFTLGYTWFALGSTWLHLVSTWLHLVCTWWQNYFLFWAKVAKDPSRAIQLSASRRLAGKDREEIWERCSIVGKSESGSKLPQSWCASKCAFE